MQILVGQVWGRLRFCLAKQFVVVWVGGSGDSTPWQMGMQVSLREGRETEVTSGTHHTTLQLTLSKPGPNPSTGTEDTHTWSISSTQHTQCDKEGDISAFIILSFVNFTVSYLLNQTPAKKKVQRGKTTLFLRVQKPLWRDNLEMWTTAKLGNPEQEKRMLANHFISGTC